MRIFLLPLTTRQTLIFCQRANPNPQGKLSIPDRVTKKAAETWAQWEAAKGGWRKQIVTYGNRGLRRIPYQEWGLKSFPPSNPKLQAEQIANNEKFDVVYPSNVMHSGDVPKVMARLARERKQLHWNRFIGTMVAMPFTVPFALVPVIPNIPFFYMAYRCWSHWRALKGSDHLDFILDHRLYRPISPPEVEDLYEQVAPDAPDFKFITRAEVLDDSVPPEQIILPADSHDLVAKVTGVPELSGEVERAVWQVQRQFEREKSQQAAKQSETAGTKPEKDDKGV
ncbi:hypothetical protein LTR99_005286 [Exophiala xenobiotica]|uniref:Mitochondrial K+-H+ exchange-related-domain-containing protein n=1 Tax=Vermiconidia calcicola TaxID=1690605 RepID=A0AAV9Q603_9PEZI|nr:hypothetical protein LTR92_004043 [Exophiala xenobiotica]KAK5535956.1 hypothetical protein LTR25_005858 [Vermiconidia calcicola]KAK5548899.1 hypothetical protein LTR23_001388 [Chaetothyriales sp. CCFEE 6169]KAK5214086.1 hypothetical protein LTR41_000278 [Exophiala xenobiotica]KAK5227155.1 hypothetical protein LTR72_003145 [Exophiala xenobiotica]